MDRNNNKIKKKKTSQKVVEHVKRKLFEGLSLAKIELERPGQNEKKKKKMLRAQACEGMLSHRLTSKKKIDGLHGKADKRGRMACHAKSLLFSLIALRSNNLTLNGGRMAVRWGGFWLFNASERQENLYEKM